MTAQLGKGYNSLIGESRGHCVESTQASSFSASTEGLALEDSMKVEYVRSSDALEDVFGVGGSVDARLRLLGVGLSAEAKYATADRFSSRSSFVIVKRQSFDEPESISRVRLSSDALTLLRRDPLQFIRRCGDSFIEARVRGARFFGVAEFTDTNDEVKREFGASVGASWLANAEFSTEFKSALKKFSTQTKYTIIANGTAQPLPTPENFADFARKMLRKQPSGDSRTPIAFVTQSYEVAENFPVDVDFPSLQHHVQQLDTLAKWRSRLSVQARDVTLARGEMKPCENRKRRFQIELGRLKRGIQDIEARAAHCASRTTRRCEVDDLQPDLRPSRALIKECSSRARARRLAKQREQEAAREQAACRGHNKQGCPPCTKWSFARLEYDAPRRKPSGSAWDFGDPTPELVLTLRSSVGGDRTSSKRTSYSYDWSLSTPLVVPARSTIILSVKDIDVAAHDHVETLRARVDERLDNGVLLLGSGSAKLHGRCVE